MRTLFKLNQKKGISEIISYVLILGLAVALGAMISVWYQSTTQKQTSGIINPIEGTSQCQDVNVNVAFDYQNCAIAVYNTGTSLINSFKVTYSDSNNEVNITDYHVKILPRLSNTIPLAGIVGINPSSLSYVSVVPIVIVNKQPYYCTGEYSFQTNGTVFDCA